MKLDYSNCVVRGTKIICRFTSWYFSDREENEDNSHNVEQCARMQQF